MKGNGRIETVVWDFNGTLIDDIDLCVRSVNPQLEGQGLPTLTAEAYRDVFGFPVQDYYRKLGVDFERISMTQLAEDFFAIYEPELKHCPLHEGVLETIDRLVDQGVRQFVLSAMEQGMLRTNLAALGVLDRFEAAYGLADQNGASKITRGRELLTDFDIDPSTALMVGDTVHDAEVAVELGMQIALVPNGHQSEERLRQVGCAVVRDVRELLLRSFR